MYSIKTDALNNIKYKARFVAKGYKQSQGLNYLETYAPTAHFTSIRWILNIAIQANYITHQCDVNNAYLNSDLDYDIYMSQPDGFINDPSKVCRLQKSIY